MGMFDYVDINYDMPTPKDATQEQEICIKNTIAADNFQTQDLHCVLDVFYIDKNGYMYQKNGDEYKQYYVHQHVECYTSIEIPSENLKYWLSYNIKFTDGKIQQVTINEWRPLVKGKL